MDKLCLKIVLVRHGKPMISHSEKIFASQLPAWIQRYDLAPIDLSFAPPLPLLNAVIGVRCIVTSPLRRSIESAKLLVPELSHHILWAAREAELPIPPSPTVKISARNWCALSRLAWFIGWSSQAESLLQAQERARFVVKELENLAQERGRVLLLGHGIMNLLIDRHLLNHGWKSLQVSGSGYWKFSEYKLDNW
jgi:broad specificity phosphatase PhoE